MKATGSLLSVVGAILIILALVRHFVSNALGGSTVHLALYLGIVGVIVLVLGLFMTRSASAKS